MKEKLKVSIAQLYDLVDKYSRNYKTKLGIPINQLIDIEIKKSDDYWEIN